MDGIDGSAPLNAIYDPPPSLQTSNVIVAEGRISSTAAQIHWPYDIEPVSIRENRLSFSTRWLKSFPTVVASSAIQYSCLLCKKSFARRCDLNRHNMNHTRPYRCRECGKRFAFRKDLDRHSNIWVHGQDINYLCTFSNCLSSTTDDDGLYAFGRVDRWRTHMIKKHGLSLKEVRAIMEKGIPMEKGTSKRVFRNIGTLRLLDCHLSKR